MKDQQCEENLCNFLAIHCLRHCQKLLGSFKAMLHEAIFLQRNNHEWKTLHVKVQVTEGMSHARNFCSQLWTPFGRYLEMLPVSERRALIGSFPQGCVASCAWHVTRSNLFRALWKVEDIATCIATCNATFCCIIYRLREWRITRANFWVTCNATSVALQVAGKISSCNMAFTPRETWM